MVVDKDEEYRQSLFKKLERLLTLMTERALTLMYYVPWIYWKSRDGQETKSLIAVFHKLRDRVISS